MQNAVFSSAKIFRIKDLTISHSHLILSASGDADAGIKEEEIVFIGLEYLQIGTTFKGIAIRFSTLEESGLPYRSLKAYVSHDKANIFAIESEGYTYYVAASFIMVYEYDLPSGQRETASDKRSRRRLVSRSDMPSGTK